MGLPTRLGDLPACFEDFAIFFCSAGATALGVGRDASGDFACVAGAEAEATGTLATTFFTFPFLAETGAPAAEAAAAAATGDVPVGAVVLDAAGSVIARGRNRREADGDPTAHAEINAIRAAASAAGGWRLDGLTLVVTLEPCTMCAGAITAARLSRLVFGAPDPRAGAVGSLWDVVRDRRLAHRPEVILSLIHI